MAARRAREGGGPTLIEGLTYRLGAHTTSDDPTKYRSDAEVKQWEPRDPIIRLERYLSTKGLMSPEEATRLREQSLDCARAAFEETEQAADTTLEDTFAHLFLEMPPVLAEQLERRKS
jgi:pyruvate dehydrogenase E1 component alpha subunit